MKTRKKPPVKFTKQKMIDDINSLRKMTMESQIITSDICKIYPSLYNYRIANDLIKLGFLRLTQKKGKSSYYKWNFDSKIDSETFDALFKNVIIRKKNITQKYAQNKIIKIKKQELIKSQEKANLEPVQEMPSTKFDLSNTKIWIGDNRGLSKRVQEKAFDLGWNWMNGVREIMNTQDKNLSLYFYQDRKIAFGMFSKDNFDKRMEREIFESDLFPEVEEVVMQEIELPKLFNFWSPDKQARYLGLVPTEEEIQGWKDEIEDLKIKLEKASIELQSLKTEMKRKDDYVYDMSFKNQDELDKVVKHYEKLLSEKTLEPTFVPKEKDKKTFVPVLEEVKKQKIESQKPTKYLKLFGYMIYEKN